MNMDDFIMYGFICCSTGLLLYLFYVCFLRRKQYIATNRQAVLITGCDTGFGHALAIKLHQVQGLHVFAGCLDVKSSGARHLAGLGISTLQLDVTKQADVEAARDTILKQDVDLYALVSNAGMQNFGEVELMPLEYYDQLIQVNYLGAVRVIQSFLPLLRRATQSRVVIVSSLMGTSPVYNLSGYCGSKFALEAFGSVLRQEGGKWGLQVSVVQPGAYKTSIGAKNVPDYMDNLWAKASEPVKQDYGSEYFDAYKSLVLGGSSKTEEVVNVLTEAVLLKVPNKYYRAGPGSTILPVMGWIFGSAMFESWIVTTILHYVFASGAKPKMLQNKKEINKLNPQTG